MYCLGDIICRIIDYLSFTLNSASLNHILETTATMQRYQISTGFLQNGARTFFPSMDTKRNSVQGKGRGDVDGNFKHSTSISQPNHI